MKSVLLGSVCEVNPSPPRDLQGDASCSFVPMEAVDDAFGEISRLETRRVADVETGYSFFANNDVIFAKITPCMENGKAAIPRNLMNGIGFGSTEFHTLRMGKEVLPEWVFYFLRQDRTRQQAAHRMTGSAGQKRVPPGVLEELAIPITSIPEQRRIVGLLTKADDLRRMHRYAVALEDNFRQAVFAEMFGDPALNPRGWEQCLINDVVASSQYGTSKPFGPAKRGYLILGMGNITDSGRLNLTTQNRINLSAKEFNELRLSPGDIIFNRTNSTGLVGKTAVWDANVDAVLASYLVRIRLKANTDPVFFATLLNTPYFKNLFQRRCKKAIGQSNISPTLLREFCIFLPKLPVQRRFSEIIRQTIKRTVPQEEALRQAEHLFQTLLHQAFSTA